MGLQQVIRLWHHTTAFFDIGGGIDVRYRRARVKATPAAVVAGIPFLAAALLFAFRPPTRHVAPNALQVIALVCSILVVIVIFGVVPAIFFFNLPKRFVPPHLFDQPGFIVEGRGREQNSARSRGSGR